MSAAVTSCVSRETLERVWRHLNLLAEWNARVNLLGNGDLQRLFERHADDGMRVAALVHPEARMADIGSGGGCPGLIVALVANRHVTLFESDQRKAAFLRESARLTAAPVTVRASRFESGRDSFDLVMARAVAPLATLLEWVHDRLAPGGRCLFIKGSKAGGEIADAQQEWRFHCAIRDGIRPDTGPILDITGLRRL